MTNAAALREPDGRHEMLGREGRVRHHRLEMLLSLFDLATEVDHLQDQSVLSVWTANWASTQLITRF